MKDNELFYRGADDHYPLKWWQLWRWNGYWLCYTYRYRWLRDLVDTHRSNQNE